MRDKQNTAMSTAPSCKGVFAISHIVTHGSKATKSNEWTLASGKDFANVASPQPKSAIIKFFFVAVLKADS